MHVPNHWIFAVRESISSVRPGIYRSGRPLEAWTAFAKPETSTALVNFSQYPIFERNIQIAQ
jgi:hypothetical protein